MSEQKKKIPDFESFLETRGITELLCNDCEKFIGYLGSGFSDGIYCIDCIKKEYLEESRTSME